MLYASGFVLAFFCALLLLAKKHKSPADYVLMLWMLVSGFHLGAYYLLFTEQYVRYPGIIALASPFPLLHGPLLYLYTLLQTNKQPLRPHHGLHFLALLLSYALFLPFLSLSSAEKVAVIQTNGKGFELPILLNGLLVCSSGVVYIILSWRLLARYRRNLNEQLYNTERINLRWLQQLIVGLAAIWLIVVSGLHDNFVFGAATLYIFWLGFFGIQQVQVFSQRMPPHLVQTPLKNEPDLMLSAEAIPVKYQKSRLTESELTDIYQRLLHLLDESQPYTDPNLTLNTLSDRLNVHPNYLSQVINSQAGKSFYDLINQKRVEAFLERLQHPSSQQYTLLGLAYDCGFNSKASFNRNFKKHTGSTPSEYLKMQQIA